MTTAALAILAGVFVLVWSITFMAAIASDQLHHIPPNEEQGAIDRDNGQARHGEVQ